MNTSVPVFRSQFLASGQKITSGPIAAMGNKLVLTSTIINISGATCTFYVDGTYNGGASWVDNIASALAPTTFGVPTPATSSALDFPHVRVRVESTGGATLFDATLAFSEQ